MVKVKLLNSNGKEISKENISDKIFNYHKINDYLLKQVIDKILANRRSSNAHTKTRAEVRGGGKKPWKQKGTGNARAGSSRSPLWIGGGVTFGPTNKINWTKKINKKMNKSAIFMALTYKIKDKKFILLDKINIDKPKTKNALSFLRNLPIEEGSILFILSKFKKNVELSMRNLPYIKIIKPENLNVYDILKYDYIITEIECVKKIENIFLKRLSSKSAQATKK